MKLQLTLSGINVDHAGDTGHLGGSGEFLFAFRFSRTGHFVPGLSERFAVNASSISLKGGASQFTPFSCVYNHSGFPVTTRFEVTEVDGPLDPNDRGFTQKLLTQPEGSDRLFAYDPKPYGFQVHANISWKYFSHTAAEISAGQKLLLMSQGLHTAPETPSPCRWLDGNTVNGKVIGQQNYNREHDSNNLLTGTRWKIEPLGNGEVTIQCLGDIPGPAWLDGNTVTGEVKLAPTTGGGYTGTRWRIHNVPDQHGLAFECLGNVPGPRWLDANTVTGEIKLVESYGNPYTGAIWSVFNENL